MIGLLAAVLLGAAGCGKSESDGSPTATPPEPKKAATELQQAFATAQPEVQSVAQQAVQSLQAANYEQAVQSLQAIRARQGLTPEQSMAVYNTSRALEAGLISAMESGDPNARKAYEALRKSRRN